MAKQSPTQKKIVERVMHEFKAGDLEQRNGAPVENPKQAIAIALSEAGGSNQKSAAGNRRALRHTVKAGGASSVAPGSKNRDALYQEAMRRDIPGRSKMTKAQLEHALGR